MNIDSNIETLASIARHLRNKSDAFEATGNEAMSNFLHLMANQIMDEVECIEEAHSKMVNQLVKQADEASVNMVNAALAGTKLGGVKDACG